MNEVICMKLLNMYMNVIDSCGIPEIVNKHTSTAYCPQSLLDTHVELSASELTSGLTTGQHRRVSLVMYANDRYFNPTSTSTVAASDGGVETGGGVVSASFADTEEVQLSEPLEYRMANPLVINAGGHCADTRS